MSDTSHATINAHEGPARDPASRDRERIKGEYREMPGLKLTAAQASRFWHLGLDESTNLLDSLVQDGALTRTHDGFYIFASGR